MAFVGIVQCVFILGSFLVSEQPIVELCGFTFTEGPLWVKDIGWIFSDIPANAVYKLDKTPFREPSGNSNGLAVDKEGRIYFAEHGNRRVSRMNKDGTFDVIAEKYQGKRLNSPNDLVIARDGTVFFTDPPYGLPGGMEGPNSELGFCGIYCVTTGGEIRLLNKNLKKPNGIALSRDEKMLYVADTEQNAVYKFVDFLKEGLIQEVKFCDVPMPDGIKMDTQNHLWVTSSEGVVIFDDEGHKIGSITIPKQPSNCAFGGEKQDEFFVTGRDCVYIFRLKR
ncbi:MAG TPA: SMP-30/gluconolactonase/LRE family protein [Candidatus Hydrogenedens sp.]|nr:SMP-30/gluconolactonase/LRE family protein [Candidatus Hydrogenedens sp.]HOL20717.1 SMP-30/gluconolactonase/LRE family protein [Candidatus Hydrogenedens sp.]HPP58553.1 SMP-30/gluconolactonase/LRE family protein [Candidatus Hydrogenedens sp.]